METPMGWPASFAIAAIALAIAAIVAVIAWAVKD